MSWILSSHHYCIWHESKQQKNSYDQLALLWVCLMLEILSSVEDAQFLSWIVLFCLYLTIGFSFIMCWTDEKCQSFEKQNSWQRTLSYLLSMLVVRLSTWKMSSFLVSSYRHFSSQGHSISLRPNDIINVLLLPAFVLDLYSLLCNL